MLALWLLPLSFCEAWRSPDERLWRENVYANERLALPAALLATVTILWIALAAAPANRVAQWRWQTFFWFVFAPLVHLLVSALVSILLAANLTTIFGPEKPHSGGHMSFYVDLRPMKALTYAFVYAVPVTALLVALIAWVWARRTKDDAGASIGHALTALLLPLLLFVAIATAGPWRMRDHLPPIPVARTRPRPRFEMESRQLPAAKAIVARNGDPNVQIGWGTPLTVAIIHRDYALARDLIRLGAIDRDGLALYAAIDDEDPEGVRIVLTAHPPLARALLDALRSRWADNAAQREVVRLLVAAGANTNVNGSDGRTVLDYATKVGDADIIAMLRAAAREPRR